MKEEEDNASLLLKSIVKSFRKYKPTVEEILVVYGNLGYLLGASIQGIPKDQRGPGPEEVWDKYKNNPEEVSWALMAVGIDITSWANNLQEKEETDVK